MPLAPREHQRERSEAGGEWELGEGADSDSIRRLFLRRAGPGLSGFSGRREEAAAAAAASYFPKQSCAESRRCQAQRQSAKRRTAQCQPPRSPSRLSHHDCGSLRVTVPQAVSKLLEAPFLFIMALAEADPADVRTKKTLQLKPSGE